MTPELLDAALSYASCNWPVFLLHTPVDGRCSCGFQITFSASMFGTKATMALRRREIVTDLSRTVCTSLS